MAARDEHLLAEEIVAACRQTLPPLAGAILHGSLASGDFVPGQSDVDVLAIVDEESSVTELTALTSALDVLRRDAVAAADLCVVTRRTAAAPTPDPPVEIYVRLDPTDARLEVDTRRPRRDLVVEFSVCRAHGRSLTGTEARELIGEVPDEWVMDVGGEVLATWQRQDYDPAMAAFMVQTACRIWRFAEERVHCSKQAAARWVRARDPSLTVVEAALREHVLVESEIRQLMARAQTATRKDPPRSPGSPGRSPSRWTRATEKKGHTGETGFPPCEV
jgi:predicted nucleotidyltransferase